MRSRSLNPFVLFLFSVALTGCGGKSVISTQGSSTSNASVVLAVTDTPPSNVSILAAQVTLTGATLNPGNVPIFSGSSTLELTRLQTDTAYLGTASVTPGTYTSLNLTFANPVLTIENDTASPIVSGSVSCAVGTICTIAPTSTVNLSTTIALPALALSANSVSGLLVDVRINNLLNAALGADFNNGVTVAAFSPGGTGAPSVGAEDVVGQIGTINAATNTFILQNAAGQFTLTADTSSSFQQFPTTVCTTPIFACVRTGQIVSADIGIRADGVPVARNIVFEDATNTNAEVEGIITSINTGLQQFTIVTLGESATLSGLRTGDVATVHYSVAPQTVFDIDYVHADASTVSVAGFMFSAPSDLSVGQQVAVSRNVSSSGNVLNADRVRLRSSRITATVQSIGAPYIQLYNLPSIFSGHGITQIQVQTSPQTIFTENARLINITLIPVSSTISVRGPLFNVSGTRTLVASRVVLKP